MGRRRESSSKKPERGAWREILSDPEVRLWHEKLALRNEGTADENGRRLFRYCRAVRTEPVKLVRRAKDEDHGRRAVEHQLQEFIICLSKPHKPSDHSEDDSDDAAVARCGRGHLPSYLNQFKKTLASYMDHHDITLRTRTIVVGDTSSAPTVEDERPLTPADVEKILAAASPRGKVIVSIVAFACGRPEVLGKRRAEDGLILGDLPDLNLSTLRFSETPAHIVIRRVLSKINRRYDSFLPAKATRYITEYLGARRARGEELTLDSPFVRPDGIRDRQGRPEELRGRPFLTTAAVRAEIRETMRACGLGQRPTALRSYFIGRMENAERDGKITREDRLFVEGRKEAIDLRYTHFKALLPETIERLRRVYAECEPYLVPWAPGIAATIAGLPGTQDAEIRHVLEVIGAALARGKELGYDVGKVIYKDLSKYQSAKGTAP